MDSTLHDLMNSVSGKTPPYSFRECKYFKQ